VRPAASKEDLHLPNQSVLVQFAIKHGIVMAVVWITGMSHVALS